jgi:hypothetical protein
VSSPPDASSREARQRGAPQTRLSRSKALVTLARYGLRLSEFCFLPSTTRLPSYGSHAAGPSRLPPPTNPTSQQLLRPAHAVQDGGERHGRADELRSHQVPGRREQRHLVRSPTPPRASEDPAAKPGHV